MKLNILSHSALRPAARRRGNCTTSRMANVKVFGADWCSMTQRTKEHLQHLGVNYEYVNVERDPRASEWVKAQNDGKERKPTLLVNGEVLTTPTNEELDAALARAA
jgi:glutaredoxin